MMEPFLFDHEGVQLLAFHHPAEGHDEGFVLCNPAPQDLMRAHQSQVSLAQRLQSLGFPVLRFDYSGTGDSAGGIHSLNRWKSEVLAAVQEFRKQSGVRTISLLGTRLGGTLAILASQEQAFKRLLLWDPIVDGATLIASYQKAHQRMLNRIPDEAPHAYNQKAAEQCCGYPWPRSLEEEIRRITPAHLASLSKRMQIVSSEDDPALNASIDMWRSEGTVVSQVKSGEDMKWGHEMYMTLRAFAPTSIRLLAQYAEEG